MRPKRSLGQNFLVDANAQKRIVDALGAGPDDEVLEIGPGPGALTRHLAGTVRRLVLVELDDDLAAALEDEFGGRDDVRVVHASILDTSLDEILDEPADALVVGNIPYNITTPILFHLLERRPRPREILLMVQREVADRIVAEPGNKTYGALSVGVRAVADVERVTHVKRGSFRPAPNVDSTVIRVTPHDPPRLTSAEEDDLRVLTRETFGRRRKQLGTSLRNAPEYALDADDVEAACAAAGVDPRARPETLAPDTFVELARALRARGVPRHLQPGE